MAREKRNGTHRHLHEAVLVHCREVWRKDEGAEYRGELGDVPCAMCGATGSGGPGGASLESMLWERSRAPEKKASRIKHRLLGAIDEALEFLKSYKGDGREAAEGLADSKSSLARLRFTVTHTSTVVPERRPSRASWLTIVRTSPYRHLAQGDPSKLVVASLLAGHWPGKGLHGSVKRVLYEERKRLREAEKQPEMRRVRR
jgi:hypothetical protein